MSKVWFITGTSRGFGREWAISALERGDKVAAAARDISTLDDLVERYSEAILPVVLDVKDRAADFAAVERAYDHFGRLDVVVNNAGYGHFGFAEETTEDEVREQIETNLFGAIWISQAALPFLRKQGHGHIIQMSSIGGITSYPRLSIYNASKWGLEGFSQSLAEEIADFGIHVTLVEPGGFATDWSGSSAKHSNDKDEYADVLAKIIAARPSRQGVLGDPKASARAILKVVDADVPPLRVIFGEATLTTAKRAMESRLLLWDEWSAVSIEAQGHAS